MAPPNKRSFSVSVVLPASGWEMIAKVRRRSTSVAMGEGISAPNDVRTGMFMVGWMWQFLPSRSRPGGLRSAGQLFAQDFKLEPLLLRCGDVLLKFGQCSGGSFESDAVPRVTFGIVELNSQCVRLGLEGSDGFGQGIECVLVLETHPPPSGQRLWHDRIAFSCRVMRLRFGHIARRLRAALRQHVAIAAGVFDPQAVSFRHAYTVHQSIEILATRAYGNHSAGICPQHVLAYS